MLSIGVTIPFRRFTTIKIESPYVHLHDYKDGSNVELGEGLMCDYPAFLKALEDIGYSDWITACPGTTDAHPPTNERTDEAKMRINRAYLKSIGY